MRWLGLLSFCVLKHFYAHYYGHLTNIQNSYVELLLRKQLFGLIYLLVGYHRVVYHLCLHFHCFFFPMDNLRVCIIISNLVTSVAPNGLFPAAHSAPVSPPPRLSMN